MLTEFRHATLRPGQIDTPHHFWNGGDFALERGGRINGLELCYVTHDSLNGPRNNTILVTTSLGGNHHRLDFLIGSGRALGPERYFIVCVDAIGNGLSVSPSNSPVQAGSRFPYFGLRDMVASQHRFLTEHLGIESLAGVVGASMGGMQALQWAVSYPDFMRNVVAMTAMARTAPWAVAVIEAARRALTADERWNGADFDSYPERGWRAWSAVMHVLANRTPAALGEMFSAPLDVLLWMERIASDSRASTMDALDWIYQSRAYEAHDVGMTPSCDTDTAGALQTVRARTLLLSAPFDLFNPFECAEEAAKQIPGASLLTIPTNQGHLGASSTSDSDSDFLNSHIASFLDE
ncbi:MAG: alpha/beta fold hydrolase [Betaproteobacteria bacterium]|nr:alpha/beta fold hydrolase [Betaproteobacteria bacterium]